MPDEYKKLRDTYDHFVRGIVPKLTAPDVDAAVGAINTLVRLQRPEEWAFSNKPRVILGVTIDGEKAVYGEVGRFGFYHADTFNGLHERISRMVETGEISDKLLENLLALRPEIRIF